MFTRFLIQAIGKHLIFGILLVLFFPTHVFSQTVGLEEIKRGWEEYTKVYFRNHDYTWVIVVDSKVTRKAGFTVRSLDGHRLVKTQDFLNQSIYLGAENEDYVFNVKKGSEDSAFALDKMSFQANRVGSDFFSWEMDLVSNPRALYFSPQIKWQSQLFGQYTKVQSIKATDAGEVVVEFGVTLPKDLPESEYKNAANAKVVLQGAPYYLPREFSYEISEAGTRYRVKTTATYTDETIPQLVQWTQTATAVDKNSEMKEAVQKYTFDYEVEAPSSADFRLTAYGLKEPESIPGKPSSFNYAWALLAFGIVVVVVGLFLRFKKSRS